MRSACLILMVGIGNLISAQPVLQQSNVAPIGYKALLRHVINGNITPGSSGANLTWDFSMDTSLSPVDSTLFLLVADPSATPFGSQFSTANYALEESQEERVQYLYAEVTPTVFEDTADNVISDSNLNVYPVPRVEFSLPFKYLDAIEKSFTEINISTTNDTTQYIESIIYDAYGTLKTPFGTYDSVVLVLNTIDSISTYTWWSTNPVFQLLSLGSSDTTFYVPEGMTGIEQPINTVQNLNLYPNPSAGNSTLIFTLTDPSTANITLYDLSGREMTEVFNGNLPGGTNHISLDDHNLASGLYLLSLTINGESKRIKYVKL